MQLSQSALSVGFYDSFTLFTKVAKNVSCEHIFFALSWVQSLIFCISVFSAGVEMTFHVSLECA